MIFDKAQETASREAVSRLEKILHSRAQRMTPARLRLIRALFEMEGSFTAKDLISALEATDGHRVSVAAVYRLLPLLVEAGVLTVVSKRGEPQCYIVASRAGRRHEFVCSVCGKSEPLESQVFDRILRHLAADHGYSLGGESQQISGRCPDCQRTLELL